MIQGGDPNTRSDDLQTWGAGGPGYTLPYEETGLFHFSGVLSAAKRGQEIESSGSQFFITAAPAHHLDGKRVVFGRLSEGLDVIRRLASLPLADSGSGRPLSPPLVISARIAT